MLSKISQVQKDKYCRVSLIWESTKVDPLETENKKVVRRKGGSEGQGQVGQWVLGYSLVGTRSSGVLLYNRVTIYKNQAL
jgi:hypothetical protein